MIAWYNGGYLPSTLVVSKGLPSQNDGSVPVGEGATANCSFVPLMSVAAIVDVVQVVICNEWYYWTDDGAQGPFTHAQMSVWHEHGYLGGSLPVKKGGHIDTTSNSSNTADENSFHPLSDFIGVDF